MGKKTVVVLFGGVSSEHEVSLVSAGSVINNIPKDKYEVMPVGITREGNWYYYFGDLGNLADSSWEQDKNNLIPCFISVFQSQGALGLIKQRQLGYVGIDCVFPVLHGKNGEDGTVQGMLQLADIPCVGCGMTSSAVCMDKAITNALADSAGIAQAKWLSVMKYDYDQNPDSFAEQCGRRLGYPCFVKPANAGSSVGISKVKSMAELAAACELAFKHDQKIIAEQAIDGMEVETAIFGNDQPTAAAVGEIVPCNEFYDYDAKYIAGTSQLHIPARLERDKQEEIQRLALRAYKTFGCRGIARIDFFVQKSDGMVLFNELNTIPGFTSISMYPKLFEAIGVPYPDLLDKLIEFALE